jgi:serine/threonine-protein kinase HipA
VTNFEPIRKLNVIRTLSSGKTALVGVLAQNRSGVFFQYEADYLRQFGNLSPFALEPESTLQEAPKVPHGGLHGVFGDCLPDGWGLLLQDRIFRQKGIMPHQVTGLDRLAFVGHRGMGALSFEPESPYSQDDHQVSLATLGMEAQALFDGQTEEVLSSLVAAGSSGGARPKAQLFFSPGEYTNCRTYAEEGDEAWLVKFTSKNLALGHQEGLCEAAYLTLAKAANLEPPEWKLLDAPSGSGAKAWLALKRFDWVDSGSKGSSVGRKHMHSICGLLDADFRMPSLDYQDLIKASRHLCKSPAAGQLQFRRAMFNLFASNQDDHTKNWAFLQNDDGQWNPAPFYDVTFSPHPFNEHATSFMGYGNQPPLKAIQALAVKAGFKNWNIAQKAIHEIVDVLSGFPQVAKELGVQTDTANIIEATLEQRRQENSNLLKVG